MLHGSQLRRTLRCSIRAQDAEGNFGEREIRLGLFDDAAERLECFSLAIDHGAHARIEGHAAEILEPGHAYALEAAVERAREKFSRLID